MPAQSALSTFVDFFSIISSESGNCVRLSFLAGGHFRTTQEEELRARPGVINTPTNVNEQGLCRRLAGLRQAAKLRSAIEQDVTLLLDRRLCRNRMQARHLCL